MSIDRETLLKLAKLSRLELKENELDDWQEKVGGILTWVEQLQKIDTDGIEPLRSVIDDLPLKQREDKITDGDIQSDILSNAPENQEGYFVVPKVVE